MRRDLALGGRGGPSVAGQAERPARSIACLAFVTLLGAAFWAGALWFAANIFDRYGQGGF